MKPEAVIIGEVWEDGSNKVAYDVRRRHLLGRWLDGLMNYPFRNAAIAWLLGGDAAAFRDSMETLRENYPPAAYYSSMNSLGTHDTPRILTLLGVGSDCGGETKEQRSRRRLTPEERELGVKRLKLGSLVQYCFPGSPTLYYGDEAGMEGFEDPFNRRPYPWGGEDRDLIAWFSALGAARRDHPALRRGDIRYLAARGGLLAFSRSAEGEVLLCACNAGTEPAELPLEGRWADLWEGSLCPAGEEEGTSLLSLPPLTGRLLRKL